MKSKKEIEKKLEQLTEMNKTIRSVTIGTQIRTLEWVLTTKQKPIPYDDGYLDSF